MAKAPVIEERQLRHMLKVAAVTGESPLRDVALLYVLYGTGMMLTELASLTVRDFALESGAVREKSVVRATIAHNSKERPVFWVNAKVVTAVDSYLAYRVTARHGVTTRTAAYRGLDPDGPIFRRTDGDPYKLTQRTTASGAISYSCDALSQVLRRLHVLAAVVGDWSRMFRPMDIWRAKWQS